MSIVAEARRPRLATTGIHLGRLFLLSLVWKSSDELCQLMKGFQGGT